MPIRRSERRLVYTRSYTASAVLLIRGWTTHADWQPGHAAILSNGSGYLYEMVCETSPAIIDTKQLASATNDDRALAQCFASRLIGSCREMVTQSGKRREQMSNRVVRRLSLALLLDRYVTT